MTQRMGRRPVPIEDRFWPRVNKGGPIPEAAPELGPCWIWLGKPNVRTGYGRFWDGTFTASGNPNMVGVHQWAYRHFKGEINGLSTLHRCDVRLCVNYESHLFLGTKGDNNRDRAAKGRSARGERHPDAKLTEDQVVEIRRLYDAGLTSERRAAAQFGVSCGTISSLLRRKSWKHVA